MARDRIRARQGCRKAENKTEGVRLTLQPITTNPAPDYGIKGDAKITKNLKYGDHLRKRAIPTNTGKRTNPGRFIRILDETRMRALAVREWIKQQNPVLIHGRPKKGICRPNGVVDTMWQAAEHFKCSFEAIRKYWYYYTDVNF